jgi:hypothetical protein
MSIKLTIPEAIACKVYEKTGLGLTVIDAAMYKAAQASF